MIQDNGSYLFSVMFDPKNPQEALDKIDLLVVEIIKKEKFISVSRTMSIFDDADKIKEGIFNKIKEIEQLRLSSSVD